MAECPDKMKVIQSKNESRTIAMCFPNSLFDRTVEYEVIFLSKKVSVSVHRENRWCTY